MERASGWAKEKKKRFGIVNTPNRNARKHTNNRRISRNPKIANMIESPEMNRAKKNEPVEMHLQIVFQQRIA